MCLINAHAKLKTDYLKLVTKNTNLEGKVDGLRQTILDLERQRDDLKAVNKSINSINAELVSLIPTPIIPVTDLVMISRVDYLAKMLEAGIEPLSNDAPLDTEVSLTSKAELDRIAPELVFPADWYIDQIWDCENYALEGMSVAGKHHVSGVTLVLGDTPYGYHGFLITMDKEYNKWWLESNAGFEWCGEWFQIGEHGYLPKKVFV